MHTQGMAANFSTTPPMAQLNRQTRTPSGIHSQTRQILQNLLHLHNSQAMNGQPQGPQSKANIHRRQLQQFYLHKLFDSISDAEFLPLIPGAPQTTYNKYPDMNKNLNLGMSPNMASHKMDNLHTYNNVKPMGDEKLGYNSYAQNGLGHAQNHLQNTFSRQQGQYENGQNKRMGGQFLQQHLFGGKRQEYSQYKQNLQS
ncbi:hypothetical protein PUMCH_001845 [Australozyma saopauloensis]|uniref:Uncharacterized protein n=1 Tax=Australozyma saopauloensis TaxID=291208 RepID=A0AAX4H7J8_9ASCO|nr:hypothetical protein PUMCH_001845 [[Candida] saopauloensis]